MPRRIDSRSSQEDLVHILGGGDWGEGPGCVWIPVHTWPSVNSAELTYSDIWGEDPRVRSQSTTLRPTCPPLEGRTQHLSLAGLGPSLGQARSQGRKSGPWWRVSPVENAIFSHLGPHTAVFDTRAPQTVSQRLPAACFQLP